jgi:hypothetical protein
MSAHAETAILAGGCFWPVSFAAAPVAADAAVLVCARPRHHGFFGRSYPHRPVHITPASGRRQQEPQEASARLRSRSSLTSPMRICTLSSTRPMRSTTSMPMTCADLLERLEARIGAR